MVTVLSAGGVSTFDSMMDCNRSRLCPGMLTTEAISASVISDKAAIESQPSAAKTSMYLSKPMLVSQERTVHRSAILYPYTHTQTAAKVVYATTFGFRLELLDYMNNLGIYYNPTEAKIMFRSSLVFKLLVFKHYIDLLRYCNSIPTWRKRGQNK